MAEKSNTTEQSSPWLRQHTMVWKLKVIWSVVLVLGACENNLIGVKP